MNPNTSATLSVNTIIEENPLFDKELFYKLYKEYEEVKEKDEKTNKI